MTHPTHKPITKIISLALVFAFLACGSAVAQTNQFTIPDRKLGVLRPIGVSPVGVQADCLRPVAEQEIMLAKRDVELLGKTAPDAVMSFGEEILLTWCGIYREIVEPRAARKNSQVLNMCSGGNIAFILLSANPSTIIMVDRLPFDKNTAKNPEILELPLKQVYFNRSTYIDTVFMNVIGALWPAMKWELQALGVPEEKVEIENMGNKIYKITFKWAYPGENPKQRTVWFVSEELPRKPRLRDLKFISALKNQGCDVLTDTDILLEKAADPSAKAVGELSEHIKEGCIIISDTAQVIVSGGRVYDPTFGEKFHLLPLSVSTHLNELVRRNYGYTGNVGNRNLRVFIKIDANARRQPSYDYTNIGL